MFENEKNIVCAEIVTIGNEVVSGLIQDGNARYLSGRLHSLGIDVRRITSVGDNEAAITDAIGQALERAEIVITTGGMGSTHDDITKAVLARMFQSEMVTDQKALAMLEALFKERQREVPPGVRRQCEVPADAEVLYNEKGTAPGLLLRRDGRKLFVLPGVPLEMEHLFEKYICPDLASGQSGVIGHRLLKTAGLSEASLWQKFGPVAPLEQLVTVASLPSHLGVNVRLSFGGKTAEEVESRLDRAEALVADVVGDCIYGKDDETLEGKVGELLRQEGQTLAVAESCTGGLIGHRLTQVAGSSDYFLEAMVTYSNEAKVHRLGVDPALIEKHGAVSREVAQAMAAGVRQSSGASIGLAITGVAGPGASEEKPAGLVFIAVDSATGSRCKLFRFYQDRSRNKERSAQAALDLLRRWLQKL